jgi:CubicO group peptidase (beta-lactamase class C family)
VVVETDPRTGKKTRYSVPAQREITILDLLRHTSGSIMRGPKIWMGSGSTKLGTNNLDQTVGDMVKRLGKRLWYISLEQCGNTGYRWIACATSRSGLREPYDRFLERRIFKPLGMNDTGYWVPAEKQNRFRLYAPGEGWTIKPNTTPAQSSYLKPAVNFGGGSQTVSTASDYLRFCQMLNGGELDGVRILSRKTVELMTSDHLGDMPRGGIRQGLRIRLHGCQ